MGWERTPENQVVNTEAGACEEHVRRSLPGRLLVRVSMEWTLHSVRIQPQRGVHCREDLYFLSLHFHPAIHLTLSACSSIPRDVGLSFPTRFAFSSSPASVSLERFMEQ